MTVDATLAVVNEIINGFYEGCADNCTLPGGGKILRVDELGHIQELVDGEWQEPTGDYAIPPLEPRTEPTPEERRCLAAANAAYVLQQVYEEATDAAAEGASTAEVLIQIIAVAVLVIAPWLGLAIEALVTLVSGLFFAFVNIARTMTADLWDAEFTDLLRCYLYECSADFDGVVMFDYQCLREKIAGYADLLDPDFINHAKLFGQIDFILSWIGVDGLNAAGETTTITSVDCSDCGNEWCYVWDFEHNGAALPEGTTMENMHFEEGIGYKITGENPPGHYDGFLLVPIDPTTWGMQGAGASYYVQSGGGAACYIFNYPEGDTLATAGAGDHVLNTDDVEPYTNLVFYVGTDAGTDSVVRQITFYGTGTNPFGFNNCPD